MTEQLTLADIVGVYGIKGWVKIRCYLDDPMTLTSINVLTMKPGKTVREGSESVVEIDAVRNQGKSVVAHIVGVDDRNEAEALRGFVLQTDPDALPAPAETEIYWRDLIGLKVWCRDGDQTVLLGEIDYMLDTGANDVAVIKACEGSVDDRERLIPWLVGDVVKGVDTDVGEVWVSWFVDA